MSTLKFDLTQKGNAFKILNATNGGPHHRRHANDQFCSNFEEYKAARIPYSRNHDSSYISVYGGAHCHDINAIFPNFDADENDPASYDFTCTDENILATLEAGTETYFRLGQSIEHYIKKYYIYPPKDYAKWARICEHVIRHYNEGWANGYELNIKYWEIWNEPDLDSDDATNKRMWVGTKAQFFDFFVVAAKYLKEKFPQYKIGGPALAWNEEWADEFLARMRKENVELDFFSWHIYCTEPEKMIEKANRIQKILEKHGYEKAESILNEWNYVRGWCEEFVYSLKTIRGLKGAAFVLACMCEAQHSPIDMLMYYDTRSQSAFNGAFDMRTKEPLKPYYPLLWYGKFYDMQAEIPCSTKEENVYTLCGKDKEGKTLTVVDYYTEHETDAKEKEITLDFGEAKADAKYEIYLLDETHDGELVDTMVMPTFTMKPNTCVLVKETD